MTHPLKHIAFRLWGTVLFGGLASLWLLPLFDFGRSPAWAPLPAGGLAFCVFFGLGWLFNRLALYLIDRHVREASTWERLGDNTTAGAAYEKALAVFDSFLISPRTKRIQAERLTSRLTRFYLARAHKQPHAEAFIAFYLNAHPDDHEVAEHWLRQARSGEGLEARFQDTAARIGEALQDNRPVQLLLARLYLAENRTDFPALQAYRRAVRGRSQAAMAVADNLAGLFLKEGRADEWALQLYLQAAAGEKPGQELLNGIAACVHWIPETERNRKLIEYGKRLLKGINPDQQALMRVGFTPPRPLVPPTKRSPVGKITTTAGKVMRKTADATGRLFSRGLQTAWAWSIKQFHRLRRAPRARLFIKWATVTLLSTAVLLLIVNTARHLARTGPGPEKHALPVEKVVTDRFTLQVAAYLKKKHAEKYVARLKAQGLDAYWTETTRHGKLWFQVRLAHFPDKAAARAYGLSLRKQGLIDDFYVANYQPG